MGQRRYPPLTPAEVIAILKALGFSGKNQEGSHRHFERPADNRNTLRRVVSVDMAEREFDDFLMKSMIGQSGFSREIFYGSTKKTARKAAVPFVR